ncbi:MAG: hypothetical protein JO048_12720 [Methylobacteriaceae bacterium]|nr:hypothetical protein [Methylobacteriaceae bacterium]
MRDLSRFATLAAALLIAGMAAAAEPVFPPGSRIGIVPPPDMVPARGLAGFQSRTNGAAIVLIEMPAEAYPSVAAGFTDEALKQQGFVLTSRESPKVGAADAILVSGEQSENGRTTAKSILVAADPTMTALVVAQYLPSTPESVRAELVAAMKTMQLRPPLPIERQIEALPFRLGDLAGFRPVRVLAGNSILLTDGPKDQIREAEQPVLIVAQSFTPGPPPEQREALARAALVANTLLKETVLERSQGFRQGGADWHEIVATAKDGISDRSVVVMQTIRFEPDGYTRTVGIVRAEVREAVMPRFRRIVDSIAPK